MITVASSTEVAQHTKDTIQVWRDCASLRILIQSGLHLVHEAGATLPADSAVSRDVDASIVQLLQAAASRVSSKKLDGQSADWESISALNKVMMEYCLKEADVWHEKTKAPSRKNLKALDQSISSQMEYVMNDPDQRCVKRCRGINPDEYDDAPLYAALLKESVQKGASGDEYTAMKLATKFGKKQSGKEVDRRASKGRKIRYSVIEKLVNFMAARPVPLSEGTPITDPQLVDAFVGSVFQ